MKTIFQNIIRLVLAVILVFGSSVESDAQLSKLGRKLKTKSRKYARDMVKRPAMPLETYMVRDQYEVIGFEPSWLILNSAPKKHYYNLLTTLVIGEYDINTMTGLPRSPKILLDIEEYSKIQIPGKKKMRKANIIEYANYSNDQLNILLHVTCQADFGGETKESRQRSMRNFLQSAEIRTNFQRRINSILSGWSQKYRINPSRLGVVLDFKNFKEGSFVDLANFVEECRSDWGDDYKIFMKVPCFTGPSFAVRDADWDTFRDMMQYIDMVVVEAYGVEKYSRDLGPTIQISNKNRVNDSKFTLENSIHHYTSRNIGVDSLAYVFPYYGVNYDFRGKDDFSLNRQKTYYPLDNPESGKSGKIFYSPDSTFVYHQNNEIDLYTFFDNYNSFHNKMTVVRDSFGLNNVGVWGLGYWIKLQKNGIFEQDVSPYALFADNFGKKKPKVGWCIAGWITFFIPLGFLFSLLRHWQVRNVLAKYRKFFIRFQLCLMVSFILFMIIGDIIPGTRGPIGFAIGAIIIFIFFMRIFIRKLIARSRRFTRYAKYIK